MLVAKRDDEDGDEQSIKRTSDSQANERLGGNEYTHARTLAINVTTTTTTPECASMYRNTTTPNTLQSTDSLNHNKEPSERQTSKQASEQTSERARERERAAAATATRERSEDEATETREKERERERASKATAAESSTGRTTLLTLPRSSSVFIADLFLLWSTVTRPSFSSRSSCLHSST